MAWKKLFQRNPRLERAYAGITGGRRLWPMQVALVAGIAIAVVPVVVAAAAGLIVGAIVYTVCSAIESLRKSLPGGTSGHKNQPADTHDAVRENVRVIRR